MKGPTLVHVVTEKGKGYRFAEAAPERFHGIGPFDLTNGVPHSPGKKPTYTQVFGRTMLRLGGENEKIVAILRRGQRHRLKNLPGFSGRF